MQTIVQTIRKHGQLVTYLICGVITTAVNFAAYYVLASVLGIHCIKANALAWTVTVAVAFLVNKILVFRSKSWDRRTALLELTEMALARLVTLGMETAILYIAVQSMHADRVAFAVTDSIRVTGDMAVKFAAGILVVLTNYGLSKTVIFRNRHKD